MPILPISLTLAAAAALINIWLSIRIGQIRRREKISVGDGGNEALIRRMRAQANFLENTPFVLVLVLLIEMGTGAAAGLWGAMALYVAGRVLHAIGMDGSLNWGRMVGTLITMLTQAGLAIFALYLLLSSQG